MPSRVKSPRKGRRVQRPKKRYVPRPDIRAKLLDAAEGLFREEGYGAATARRIANRVGMKHQAVFYYFDSQDELLLALFRRQADMYRERLEAALNSQYPLLSLWEVIGDADATKLGLEFMALATHNTAVRTEIARNAVSVRALETAAIARYLDSRGIKPRLSPQFVSILTNAMARLLVQEATLGIHAGHEEAETLVYNSFRNFEAAGDVDAGVEPIVDAISTSR